MKMTTMWQIHVRRVTASPSMSWDKDGQAGFPEEVTVSCVQQHSEGVSAGRVHTWSMHRAESASWVRGGRGCQV